MSLDFYDQHFLKLMQAQSAEFVERNARFILEYSPLKRGHRLLDQGCGIGRLSWALARHGLEVTGIDQSPDYIAQAENHQAPADPPYPSLSPQFICADARRFQFETDFDGIVSWNTSFGHHLEHDDNQALLNNLVHHLRPEGVLVLDYANFDYTRAHFQPQLIQKVALPEGPLKVVRHSQFLQSGHFKQDWDFHYPNGETHRRTGQIHAYTPSQLSLLCEQAGLHIVQLYGSPAGEGFGTQSQRWIALARKVPRGVSV